MVPGGKEQGRRQEKQCVYCGRVTICTADHVIPRALFPGAKAPNMITVPACLDCNQAKGELDAYLRDVLTADLSSYDSAEARAVLEGKVRSAVRRNQSPVWRAAETQTRRVPLWSPGGIYLGDFPAIPLDGGRLHLALSMMAKGLYARHFGRRLSDGVDIDVGRIGADLVVQQWPMLTLPGSNGPFVIGMNVCYYLFFVASDEPLVVHWLLASYHSVFFIVTLKQANAGKEPVELVEPVA